MTFDDYQACLNALFAADRQLNLVQARFAASGAAGATLDAFQLLRLGYALKAGQLTYDCRYSTMHGMPVTGGRGFRGLKPLWYNGVPP